VNLEWVTNPMWLLVNSLVAFRLTRLWIDDMLPPLPRIRDAVQAWAERGWERRGITGDIHDEKASARSYRVWRLSAGQPAVAYLVTCYWCSGFWIGAAVVLAASLIPATPWALIAAPFALSAVVGLLADRTK
jgi:uncharacterized protein DUF1360